MPRSRAAAKRHAYRRLKPPRPHARVAQRRKMFVIMAAGSKLRRRKEL
jgi:hypothetical protein